MEKIKKIIKFINDEFGKQSQIDKIKIILSIIFVIFLINLCIQGQKDREKYNTGILLYNTGLSCEKEGKYTEAFENYKMASECDIQAAMTNLGCCYLDGKGCEKDEAKGFYWTKKATKISVHNNDALPLALCNLGFCYIKGKGVEPNKEEAFKAFKESAQRNYPPAIYNLVLCYKEGIGVEPNKEEAIKWCRKLAEQDISNYSNDYSEWKMKNDIREAQELLGIMYYEDNDIERAKYWLKKAGAT